MFEIRVNKNIISVQETEPLTSGSVSVYKCHFTFDTSWDEFFRSAVFRVGSLVKTAPLDDVDTCDLPWELLTKEYIGLPVEVSVYGTKDETEILPTIWDKLGRVRRGSEPGEDAKDPTSNVYDRLTSLVKLYADKVQADVSAVESAAAEAEASARAAELASKAIGEMKVSAVTLASGSEATVTRRTVNGVYDLEFGLPMGMKGDKGDTGDKGDKGDKGDTGAQGIPGEKGDKGDKGDTGAQGPKGDTGAQGIPGEKGDKGDKGDTGAQGPKGDTGAGFKVLDYYVDVSTLTSSVPSPNIGDAYGVGVSAPYDIYIYGGASGWVNNGPLQGAKGDPGEKGEKGDPGEKGDKGDKGDTGAQGIQGIPGEKGEKGDKGDKGDTGAQGIQGIPGEKGDKGDKGDTGATGATGAAGANATINGVNALTIAGGTGITATQSGSTLTLAAANIKYGTADVTAGSASAYPEGTLYVVVE